MDYSILLDKVTSWINPTTALTIMCTVVGATVGIFLAVWGGKKIINAFQMVLTKGKISVFDKEEEKYIEYYEKYRHNPGAYDDV